LPADGVPLSSCKKNRKPAYKNKIALTLSYKFGVDFLKLSNSNNALNSSFDGSFLLRSKKDLLRFVGSVEVIVSMKTFMSDLCFISRYSIKNYLYLTCISSFKIFQIPGKSSSRWASFLQRDSTRLFRKLLRMFSNACACAWHPTG
jgi:hypothetical protein